MPTLERHIIHRGVRPSVPKNCSVVSNQPLETFAWDPAKALVFLTERQKEGISISGKQVRWLLRNKQALNGAVLDYLLENRHLIPEEWKSLGCIIFLGTVYKIDRNEIVRTLHWDGNDWVDARLSLDMPWTENHPILLLAA